MYITLFLSSFLLGVFLLYRYFSNKRLYNKLNKMPFKLEDTLSSAGTTPISEGINRLLKTQYNLYQEQIQLYKLKQAEHLTFINQWVHQMKTPISCNTPNITGKRRGTLCRKSPARVGTHQQGVEHGSEYGEAYKF